MSSRDITNNGVGCDVSKGNVKCTICSVIIPKGAVVVGVARKHKSSNDVFISPKGRMCAACAKKALLPLFEMTKEDWELINRLKFIQIL